MRQDGLAGAVVLAASLVMASCTALLQTHSSIGVGGFWDAYSSSESGVLKEGYQGIGLVVSRSAFFIGWVRVERVEVDLDLAPSGSCQIGEITYEWGEQANTIAGEATTAKFEITIIKKFKHVDYE